MPKAPHQGPSDYARSVMERYAVLQRDVAEIAGHYIGLRYGPAGGRDDLKDFVCRCGSSTRDRRGYRKPEA